jgi:hypothetical protein
MENLAVTELNLNEMMAIEGGKPFSYYLGFAIGAIGGTTVSFVAGLVYKVNIIKNSLILWIS